MEKHHSNSTKEQNAETTTAGVREEESRILAKEVSEGIEASTEDDQPLDVAENEDNAKTTAANHENSSEDKTKAIQQEPSQSQEKGTDDPKDGDGVEEGPNETRKNQKPPPRQHLPRRAGRKKSSTGDDTSSKEKSEPSGEKTLPAKTKRKRQSSAASAAAAAAFEKPTPKATKVAKKAKASDDESTPKVDGRKKNKGSSRREAYSVTYKAKRIQEYEEWEATRRSEGHKSNSLKDFLKHKNLPPKYEKFLSATCGWRKPNVRSRILLDAANTEYKDMARMPDRSRNKSYYAQMEENLLKRMEECRERNLTLSTSDIRKYAKEEVRKLAKTEEEANAFKASNGWIFNFLNRQKRKQKEEEARQKLLKKQEKQQAIQQQHTDGNDNNNNNNREEEGNDNNKRNEQAVPGNDETGNEDTNEGKEEEKLI